MIGLLTCGILFLVQAVLLWIQFGKPESAKLQALQHHALPIGGACEGVQLVLLVLDFTGVLDFSGYTGLPLWCAVFGAVQLGCDLISHKLETGGATLRFVVRTFTVCTALELFVFNFSSAHLLGGDFEARTLDLSTATVTNFDPETGKNLEEGDVSLEFPEVGIPVGTVQFQAESDQKGTVTISMDASDETYAAAYRTGIASAEILRNHSRSQTVQVNLSGTVSALRFSYHADAGETITVKGITLNVPVQLHVSLVRMGILFFGSFFCHLLASSAFLKRGFRENQRGIRWIAYGMTAVFLLAALWLANVSRYTQENHSLKADFQATSGNQITQELVDAFEDGRTTIDIEMNEILAALENPYDGSQREAAQVGAYPWDHLYYEGQYYSYYGIAPVLVLFLPYHLLTGYYFPSVWAVFLFGALGILFLTKSYLCFLEKFFPQVRGSLALLGLWLMQLSSGIWFCFNVPNFYEIAQTSGFACTMLGTFFLLSSNVIGSGTVKNWRVALSGVFLSLGVLCRPTLAVYCVAALLFLAGGARKKWQELKQAQKRKLGILPYVLCALIPFAAIGSVQMAYNAVRFGSCFDFGIQYSLTINDFTHAQFHTHFAAIGFFNYLFALPGFSEKFPFLTEGQVATFQPQGYYFVATASAIGLLWKALPLLSYGKSVRAYRLCTSPHKKYYTALLLAVCVICPFVIIFSIWESGYGARYCVDFAWELILGALVIAFLLYPRASKSTKRHLNRLMIGAGVVSLILNFAQIYRWILDSLSPDWKADALSFARLFEFWR